MRPRIDGRRARGGRGDSRVLIAAVAVFALVGLVAALFLALVPQPDSARARRDDAARRAPRSVAGLAPAPRDASGAGFAGVTLRRTTSGRSTWKR